MIIIDSNMTKVPNICNERYANLWGSCCVAPAEEDGICVQGGKPDWCPIKELVRCKDCKHRGDRNKCIVAFVAEKQEMPYLFYDNRGEWFCADGVRKE